MVPHKVTILFHKKQIIQNIEIYTDYKLDESYTPQDIIIKASSSSLHNFENHIVCNKTLNEPTGWITLSLHPHKRQNKYDKYLKTNKIIFEIKSSHQSGRDTHIRQIKIFAPHSRKISNNANNKSLFSVYAVEQPMPDDEDSDEDDDFAEFEER